MPFKHNAASRHRIPRSRYKVTNWSAYKVGLRRRGDVQEIERLTKRVLDEVKMEPTCRRLMTVPGVGPLTALAFRATIDRPDRFRKSRDVGAHLGLTPAALPVW